MLDLKVSFVRAAQAWRLSSYVGWDMWRQRGWTGYLATAGKPHWANTDSLYTHDPFVAAWLVGAMDDEALEALAVYTRWASRVDADGLAPIPLPPSQRLSPFPHQVAAAHAIAARGRLLLCDTMGLGKTASAILGANMLRGVQRVLVLCPASLRINWAREVAMWQVLGLPVMQVEEWMAEPVERAWVICNYDKLIGKGGAAVAATNWDLVICDEAHRLKNPTAKRTMVALGSAKEPGLVREARYAVALTGTPVVNDPEELYTLISAIDPERWTWGRYSQDYLGYVGNKKPKKRPSPSVLASLPHRLSLSTMMRRVSAPGVKLPFKTHSYTFVSEPRKAQEGVSADVVREMDAQEATQARIDVQAIVDGARACDIQAPALRVSFAVQQRLAQLRKEAALRKVDVALDRIRERVAEVGKLVVFSHHRDVADRIREGCEGGGLGVRVIIGGVSLRARQQAVDDFQTDPDVEVIICGLEAAGEGITLTAASQVLRVETDWRPGVNDQAEARIARMGQNADTVQIEVIVAQDGIDGRLLRANARKSALARLSIDTLTKQRIITETERERVLSEARTFTGSYISAMTEAASLLSADKWSAELVALLTATIEGERECAEESP